MENTIKSKGRQSGIELLKIFAIMIIAIFHATQTLCSAHPALPIAPDYFIPEAWKIASSDINHMILLQFGNLGNLGNNIFFICSAWFLCAAKESHKKKIMYMLCDVWIISIIYLLCFELQGTFVPPRKMVISCIFPTIFANNWYVTCYILFYLAFPGFNIIIRNISPRSHLSIVLSSFILYFGINFIKPGLFFPSILIYWIVMYFTIAYIRKYKLHWFNDTRNLILLLFLGLLMMIGINLATEILGLHFGFLHNKVGHWNQINSPFILMITIALLGLAQRIQWVSGKVNYISSLTLLIYIIHENILFRRMIRPYFYVFIKDNLGYDHIIAWVILLGLGIFFTALIISIIYNKIVQGKLHELGDQLYIFLSYYSNYYIEKLI